MRFILQGTSPKLIKIYKNTLKLSDDSHLAEIVRILKPGGKAYLIGEGNLGPILERWQVPFVYKNNRFFDRHSLVLTKPLPKIFPYAIYPQSLDSMVAARMDYMQNYQDEPFGDWNKEMRRGEKPQFRYYNFPPGLLPSQLTIPAN
ncbi:MAG: hypothetical protein WCG27_10045 [Pseudomonadota bacterium]